MDTDVFEREYANLNEAQRRAVDTIEGPVMVVAGPGTGKTTVLTLRIANILRQTDTPPSGILAITFTEAGVKSMRMKLRSIIGPVADEVYINTFHGFAASVITEFRDHFVHLEGVRQMSDVESERLIRQILREDRFSDLRPLGRPDFYVNKILGAVSSSKREALTPGDIKKNAREEIERIQNDEANISTRGARKGKLKAEAEKRVDKNERTIVFADVFEEYEKKKKEEGYMDFDDLLVELLHALRNDELLLRLLQERYLYLLVDEHQDTNDAQNSIIRLIADFFDQPNLFVVGDEKQAIFRFQGASVENFLNFQKIWKDMTVIRLEKNYRSHQSILDSSFSMIEQNYAEKEYEDLRIKLKAGTRLGQRPVEVLRADDTATLEGDMIERIRALIDRSPDSHIAVITKTNRDLERALSVLERGSVPVAAQRSVDIFKHPTGSLFFDLVEFLMDVSRYDALARTVAARMWGLSFPRSVEVIRALKSTADADVIESLPELVPLQRSMLEEGALRFIMEAAHSSGYLEIVSRDPSNSEVWRGILRLSESLVRDKDIRDPRELLEELLAYKTSAESRSVKVPVGSADAPVKVMTAHGSKGLEFDHVFIPYATEQSWIGRKRSVSFVLPEGPEEGDDIKDARRLFYVALTRAREHAVIAYAEEDQGGGALTPLRFIDELDDDHISLSRVHREEDKSRDGVSVDIPPLEERERRRLVEYTKTRILERGLSVTALNHFLECPNTFLYNSVLRLPQAPSAHAEKGSAVHEALARVWESSERSKKGIADIMSRSVTEYLSQSFLSAFEKQALQKELRDKVPIIASELAEHFSDTGTAHAEMWAAVEHEVSYNGQMLRIPLHGKLDAVVNRGREVAVYDYKTRARMSEAAIKGETKDQSGGYFRQLVFYTLLLSGDERFKGKTITPYLVFVSPDTKDRCHFVTLPVDDRDRQAVADDIRSLVEAVWSGRFLDSACGDTKCRDCALRRASLFS